MLTFPYQFPRDQWLLTLCALLVSASTVSPVLPGMWLTLLPSLIGLWRSHCRACVVSFLYFFILPIEYFYHLGRPRNKAIFDEMSSFFKSMLGSSSNAPSKATTSKTESCTDLRECSLDEIITELQYRGYTVQKDGKVITLTNGDGTTAHKGDNHHHSVEEKVFNVLDAIEKWTKLDRHRNDKDRKFNELWSHLYAFDWARTPKGYCCDANKSVKIGLSEYSKYEDPESAQVLLIQHYDSERPGNYEKRNSCKSSIS